MMEILLITLTKMVATFAITLTGFGILMANIGLAIVVLYWGYTEYKKCNNSLHLDLLIDKN